MASKLDTHHVVSLTLMPVRCEPNVGNGVDRAEFFGNSQFQAQMHAVRHRIKMVNDFEPRVFAEVVDACDIKQIIERKLIAAEFCDRMEVTGCDRKTRFTAEFTLKLNFCFKCCGEATKQFLSSH